MHLSIVVIFLICLVLPALGAICQNPKVEQTSYTTVDGMVISDVAFITEFTLSCDSGKKTTPNTLSALIGNISWTESAESLSSGEHGVNVYDEAGYVAFKKAQRNSGDTSEVPSAFFLSLYHRGTYYGPWVSTEFIAATTSILLWYIAFSARSNLMSS
ncbi:Translocon-associated protein subunit delta like protein [Argiope bruennichi]|uniref:Translocon-associated protein subunit delta n=1 Tax=Argiope bruennichi TaxID=94029 RepID=A0A8T0FJH9_ARGBR|nr:Translocon-associated protein subunit delta like protein [Argiope bruennichi]